VLFCCAGTYVRAYDATAYPPLSVVGFTAPSCFWSHCALHWPAVVLHVRVTPLLLTNPCCHGRGCPCRRGTQAAALYFRRLKV
jgi:hypothetical protein